MRKIFDTTVFKILQEQKANIAFLPSVWPETFMYTLSIAKEAGFPTVAFNMGAQAEHLIDSSNALLLPPAHISSPSKINDELMRFAKEKSTINDSAALSVQTNPAISTKQDKRINDYNHIIRFSPAVTTAATKITRPLEKKSLRHCLMASYAVDKKIWPHLQYYCRVLKKYGFTVTLIVATDSQNLDVEDPGASVCDAFIIRQNIGFYFASWACALKLFPELWDSNEVIFANDSVYGPTQDFVNVLDRIQSSSADYIGLTESEEIQKHYQSYFFVLKSAALQHQVVRDFWENVRALPTKRDVIENYEVPMLQLLENSGISCEALFPVMGEGKTRRYTPTHLHWNKLIKLGFPFLKVEVLRDNPGKQKLTGWDILLHEKGYNPSFIYHHLATIKPDSSGLQDAQASLSKKMHQNKATVYKKEVA